MLSVYIWSGVISVVIWGISVCGGGFIVFLGLLEIITGVLYIFIVSFVFKCIKFSGGSIWRIYYR